jgi:hypothetical protein
MKMTSDSDHVAAAHELAVDFFRGIYGEHAVVPKEKLYDLPAYPCWALACHAYEKLLGIDPERQRRDEWYLPPSGNFADSNDLSLGMIGDKEVPPGLVGEWSVLRDQFVKLLPDYINGQWAWQNHVVDNARRIESECK